MILKKGVADLQPAAFAQQSCKKVGACTEQVLSYHGQEKCARLAKGAKAAAKNKANAVRRMIKTREIQSKAARTAAKAKIKGALKMKGKLKGVEKKLKAKWSKVKKLFRKGKKAVGAWPGILKKVKAARKKAKATLLKKKKAESAAKAASKRDKTKKTDAVEAATKAKNAVLAAKKKAEAKQEKEEHTIRAKATALKEHLHKVLSIKRTIKKKKKAAGAIAAKIKAAKERAEKARMYFFGSLGGKCPGGTTIETKAECTKAVEALKLKTAKTIWGQGRDQSWTGSYPLIPIGCSVEYMTIESFNRAKEGRGRPDETPICKRSPGARCPNKYPYTSQHHGKICYSDEKYAKDATHADCSSWCCLDDTCARDGCELRRCAGKLVVKNGQCRKPDGHSHYRQDQGHGKKTVQHIQSAAECKAALEKAQVTDHTFNCAEWSGDSRGMCWLSAVPVPYQGNGVGPYKCITSNSQLELVDESDWAEM